MIFFNPNFSPGTQVYDGKTAIRFQTGDRDSGMIDKALTLLKQEEDRTAATSIESGGTAPSESLDRSVPTASESGGASAISILSWSLLIGFAVIALSGYVVSRRRGEEK